MEEARKLGVSSKILQAVGVSAMVMGLAFILLRPIVVFLPEDARFTGLSSDQLRALSPRLFTWMGMVFRAWGAFALGFGAMIIGLARNAYARAERWAWWTLAVAGLSTLCGFFAINLYLGSDFRWVIAALFAVYVWALWLGRPRWTLRKTAETFGERGVKAL